MKARLIVLSAVVASIPLFTISVKAHDSEAVPTTCAQLADSHNYSSDVTNPRIKALKARCDAEKKGAVKPKAAAKPITPAKQAASNAK